ESGTASPMFAVGGSVGSLPRTPSVHAVSASAVKAAAIAMATARGARFIASPESHAEVDGGGARGEGTAVIGGETEGPHESGARTELAGDDLGSRREPRGEGAVDHLPHRAQQQLAGARQVTADDDARRVEDAGDIGRGDADVRARLGDGADADIVAGHGPHDDVAELEPRVAGLEPLDDGVSSRDRLEASEVAAAAQRAVLDDHGVAELARAAA